MHGLSFLSLAFFSCFKDWTLEHKTLKIEMPKGAKSSIQSLPSKVASPPWGPRTQGCCNRLGFQRGIPSFTPVLSNEIKLGFSTLVECVHVCMCAHEHACTHVMKARERERETTNEFQSKTPLDSEHLLASANCTILPL